MRVTEWYRKFLCDMKKANLKVENMPEDVAQSALVLHQKALMEWMKKIDKERKMPVIDGSIVSLQNDEVIGPQIDITSPQIIEVKYSGHTLWVNVDEVCRLRISRIKEPVRFDAPGFTQREVEG